MPPKKKEVEVERPPLGRFSSHLKIGIVGLPNVGKSTLFNTLTKMGIAAENYPFCTIEPNEARVNVPDDRFNWLCDTYKPKSKVPSFLDIWDIAGLVKGASAGEGLGNAFLSNIRAVDGIFHVCRAFNDEDITHVEERIDPVADLEIITAELRMKDLEMLKNLLAEVIKKTHRGLSKDDKTEIKVCEKLIAFLEDGKDIRLMRDQLDNDDIFYINEKQLLTAKPCVFLVNLSERDYQRKKNKWLKPLFEWVQAHGADPIIPFSGALEQSLFDMPEDEAAAYCKAEETSSALPKIITTGFKAIQLIYFFTAGADEVKCWTIRRGYKAPQGAGTIHTDFERGFICAEVMDYDVLNELGSENAVKAAGKYRQEGKNYVIKDGDVIFFKFNVTSSGKK